MTREVWNLLCNFRAEYDEAGSIYKDDEDLGSACDVLRDTYLKEALEKARTVEDCDAILNQPYMERHWYFISQVKSKRDRLKQ